MKTLIALTDTEFNPKLFIADRDLSQYDGIVLNAYYEEEEKQALSDQMVKLMWGPEGQWEQPFQHQPGFRELTTPMQISPSDPELELMGEDCVLIQIFWAL